jgi:formylglycine-generating enzyme
VAVPSAAQRAAWAATNSLRYLLPSEDEWYKAAYYKGGGTNSGYWAYPTRSNTAPINLLDPAGTNNANFYDNGFTTGSPYLTNVGAFAASRGSYGTFDQGGDVWQWNEALIGSAHGMRGGAYHTFSARLASSARNIDDISPFESSIGFRVASVPEPGSIVLVVAGGLCLLACAWRRRGRARCLSCAAVVATGLPGFRWDVVTGQGRRNESRWRF